MVVIAVAVWGGGRDAGSVGCDGGGDGDGVGCGTGGVDKTSEKTW